MNMQVTEEIKWLVNKMLNLTNNLENPNINKIFYLLDW